LLVMVTVVSASAEDTEAATQTAASMNDVLNRMR